MDRLWVVVGVSSDTRRRGGVHDCHHGGTTQRMAPRAEKGCMLADRKGIGVRRWLPDAGAIGLLVALCVLFYWSVLTPVTEDRSSFPKGDFTEQFYSYAFFRANELLQGRVPLWNPYVLSGSPFIADIQSAVFYPLGWVTTLLSGRSFPLRTFQAEAVFHVFLASAFTYLFLRRATRSRFAGLVGAVVFSYGGYLTSYPILQLAILEVQVWFPLILLFVHLGTSPQTSSKARGGYTIAAGFALGTSILSRHPQASLFVLYGTTAYFVYRLFCLWKDNGRRDCLRALPMVLGFLALGVALAAVQLLPAS